MPNLRPFLVSATLLAASTCASAQIDADFETDHRLSSLGDFNFVASATTDTAFVLADVGVERGGGVLVSTDTGGANYNHGLRHALEVGQSLTLSAFFKTNASTGESPNQVAGLGLLGELHGEFGAGPNQPHCVPALAVTLRSPDSGPRPGLLVVNIANTASTRGITPTSNQGAPFVAAPQTWYKLVVQLTKTASGGTFTVSAHLEDWGPDGTTRPDAPLRGFTNFEVKNAALYHDDTLFAGFFARQTAGNPIQIRAVDRFTVSPDSEP